MPEITVTEEGVLKLLQSLNTNKASGPDGIPNRLLKILAKQISPSLTKLFQLSLDTGQIPSIWKHAIIQPIFKKGNKSLPQNYRPISLTCVCCKILEHIIRTSVTSYLESNRILNNAQHGFRKQRSCETQLISIVDEFTFQLDKGGQTDAIFLDFAKAFDKVPHERLLAKLVSVGITGNVHRWIENFLKGRTQEVVVGGEKSNCGQVTSGVPQGSVLGPTLFLVYINDLPDSIRSKVCLFADDTLLFRHIYSVNDCVTLNEDLIKLQNWEEQWLMKFNVAKCNVLTITKKRNPIIFDYKLHGETLEKVQSSKYLGVEITKNLSWGKHIDQITSKANKTSAFIHRNLKGCPEKTQTHCFKSLVRPILEYASAVWDPHLQKDIDTLEKTQKRAARRISNNYSCQTSASGLVNNIGLEKLHVRRKKDKLRTMFKIKHKEVAVNIPESLDNKNQRTTRNNHHMILNVPFAKSNVYKNSFFPSTARIWNSLPVECVESNNIEQFNKLLSQYITE